MQKYLRMNLGVGLTLLQIARKGRATCRGAGAARARMRRPAHIPPKPPGGLQPKRQALVEDLNLLSQHWNLIRLYGSSEVAEDVLKIIHEKNLPLRVMLGAWITRESESETLDAKASQAAKRANRMEVMNAIRLANGYPDEVIAVSVGNETQVFWSDHLTQPEVLIRNIKAVRDATFVPVTTADDFNFWNKPESKRIAQELDFIAIHIHAMWAGLQAEEAMSWTERIYTEICEKHPERWLSLARRDGLRKSITRESKRS